MFITRFSRGLEGEEKLRRRKSLDRRRLEEAFLLYAVVKIHHQYDLAIDHIDFDRNILVESVVETFREKFLEKWSGKLLPTLICFRLFFQQVTLIRIVKFYCK